MADQTIPGLFRDRVKETPEATAYLSLDDQGQWQPTTWEEAGQRVLNLSRGLADLGLSPEQHVGIMALTSQAWEMAQLAILMAGGVVIGLDPRDLEENINTMVRLADITGLIVQQPRLLDKLEPDLRQRQQFVVTVEDGKEGEAGSEECQPLRRLQEQAAEGSLQDYDFSSPEGPATVIFTSGTTGAPKGIRYNHGQVVLACRAIIRAFPDIQAGSRMVCWLPLSNLFQRMINHCAALIGASTYFVPDPRKIIDLLPSIRPHVFIGVPRFFEKIHEGIRQEIQSRPATVQALINMAFRVGDRHARVIRGNFPEPLLNRLLFAVLDPLILSRFRQTMGGSLQFMISGSAPMPPWLLERFHAMGLLILEAYGISENIVPMAMNRPDAYKFGTVGLPLSANEVILSSEGEILVRSQGLCSGYYTDESKDIGVDQEGYLHTGDLAEIDHEGFLTLTGRNSEIIKTSTGRRIAPSGIEDRMRKVSLVDQAVIFGDGKKYLVALLSIQPGAKDEQHGTRKITDHLAHEVKQEVSQELQELPKYQRPAGLILTAEPFTVQGGELTHNLKLRRKVIRDKYSRSLEEMYKSLDNASSQEKTDDVQVVVI